MTTSTTEPSPESPSRRALREVFYTPWFWAPALLYSSLDAAKARPAWELIVQAIAYFGFCFILEYLSARYLPRGKRV